jgi:hypothetical protein
MKPPKIRADKLSWWALPLKELQEVVKAFNHGASPEKYKKPFTYRYGEGFPEQDMYDAVMRHMERIQAGEEIADDSQCMHWAHIAADAIMAIAGILIRRDKK